MPITIRGALRGAVVAMMLAGCAGQTEQLTMQAPPTTGQPAQPGQPAQRPQPPQQVVFPNGTVFGGASGPQASSRR